MADHKYDASIVPYIYCGQDHFVANVLLVPFHHFEAESHRTLNKLGPPYSEIHFDYPNLGQVIINRHTELCNPTHNLAIICQSRSTDLGVNLLSEIMLISDKFYKRVTFKDLGKHKSYGLRSRVDGRLVYYLTPCPNLDSGTELYNILTEALNQALFKPV